MTEKKADAGTLASPGMPLFTLEDTRSYRLEATVDENDIRFVPRGKSFPYRLTRFGDTAHSGKVTEIVPAADPASRSFLVKIELPPMRVCAPGCSDGRVSRAASARRF